MTSHITYLGDLRTQCTHSSGTVIHTDAPLDNKGKGEAFSPTDLLATSIGSCFLTIVGIYCQEREIAFHHAEVKVQKIMATGPRRVETVNLEFDFSGNDWDDLTFQKIINAGKTCPVAVTLEGKVQITYTFKK